MSSLQDQLQFVATEQFPQTEAIIELNCRALRSAIDSEDEEAIDGAIEHYATVARERGSFERQAHLLAANLFACNRYTRRLKITVFVLAGSWVLTEAWRLLHA